MNFQALLLCGGKSSRMWPLSDKIFFLYLGKTVLEYQVETLLFQRSIQIIHVVANQENIEMIKEVLRSRFSKEFQRFHFSIQKKFQRGMGDGVLAALESIDLSLPLLIMSSNDIVENDCLQKMLSAAKKSKSEIFICGKKVENYFPGGYLVLDSGKLVKKIVEKPGIGKAPSDLINLVFHLFKNPRNLFPVLQKSSFGQDSYEQGVQKLLQSGSVAEVVPYNGFWRALKFPWSHLDLMDSFLSQLKKSVIHPTAQISSRAVLSGNMVIEKDVKIFDYAVVSGPAYIGENCILGNHCLVRSSHLGSGCIVGHSTEVARSYLREKVRLHQNYVGDSVLERNVSFGAGARTGNLRLDEQVISVKVKNEKVNTKREKLGVFCGENVRVGINTSLMPGVKIGRNTFIGSGGIVSTDIEDGYFLKLNTKWEKKKNNLYCE